MVFVRNFVTPPEIQKSVIKSQSQRTDLRETPSSEALPPHRQNGQLVSRDSECQKAHPTAELLLRALSETRTRALGLSPRVGLPTARTRCGRPAGIQQDGQRGV